MNYTIQWKDGLRGSIERRIGQPVSSIFENTDENLLQLVGLSQLSKL